jgi:high-affinity iron transporter
MLIPFLIMLREGIEAALIVGIVASYLKQSGRGALMPAVWVGVLLATALSLFAGAGLQLLAAEFPQKQQELFEGVVGLIAVVMLTSMVFWMRKAARSIKGELQASIDKALNKGADGQGWALIGMVFLAVAREGLESVFFLLAVFQQSSGWEAPVGALAGIAVSVAVGWGLYSGGVRLDLRRFFRYTGLFILLVAAGLLAGVLRKLHEGGVWNHLQTVVFDMSDRLPMDSPVGAVLSGLLGYQAAPVVGEVVVYLAFLAVALFFFLRPAVHAARATRGRGRLKTFQCLLLPLSLLLRLKTNASFVQP